MQINIWPKNTTFTSSVVCWSKQLSLCHYLHTICHPFLSNLHVFAGEMFSTWARSLAAMSRDLVHILNISPVIRLESIVCLQNENWIYCKYMYGIYYRCNSILTKEKTSKLSLLAEVLLCIHVGRPPYVSDVYSNTIKLLCVM